MEKRISKHPEEFGKGAIEGIAGPEACNNAGVGTAFIPTLEEAGRQLIFLRPRRFGKSLLLSMLANYYDVRTVDDFDNLFGDLAIGQQPTAEHNQYLILRWDFSKVSAQGDSEQIKRNLFAHVNVAIQGFQVRYQQYLTTTPQIYADNAIASFESLCNAN